MSSLLTATEVERELDFQPLNSIELTTVLYGTVAVDRVGLVSYIQPVEA